MEPLAAEVARQTSRQHLRLVGPAPDDQDTPSSRARAKQAFKQATQLAGSAEPESKEAEHQASSSERATLPLRRTAAFDALVQPVEQASRRRLNGPGVGWCLRAYSEDPEGFADCVQEVMRRWQQRELTEGPLGLLCVMARDGDHHRPEPTGDTSVGGNLNRCGCTHPHCRYQDTCLG